MLVAMHLEKHPSIYLFFGIYIFCVFIIYAIMMLENIFVHMYKTIQQSSLLIKLLLWATDPSH